MMEHGDVLDRLDEFIDGGLAEEERRKVEGHLRGCVPCAQEAADTRRLLERARTLPPSILPDRDLWPEVKARLQSSESEPRPGRLGTWWRPALAAAAVLAVALTGLLLVGRTDRRDLPQAAYLSPSTSSVLAALDLKTNAAGRSLGAVLAQGASLGPGEGAAISEGLNSLALAIAECRMALAEDPDNAKLMLRLTSYYRERLELLEKATRLVRA